jgi:uncharacterized membrane protein
MQTIYLYLITFPILVLIDLAWVGGIAKNYYKGQLGAMLTSSPVWWAIVLFYLMYVAGLVYFVIAPGVGQHALMRTVFSGAFFGLIAYGTYDLTNLALTANWPVLMSFVDMAWGAFAGGLVSLLAYLIATSVFAL